MAIGKYKKLVVTGGKADIELYVGPRIHESWKTVSQELDTFTGGHLLNLLEAAVEQGKRLGRAEVMANLMDLGKQVRKQIDGIEKATHYKSPGRPRKRAKPKG
jgi:hypothetical protein